MEKVRFDPAVSKTLNDLIPILYQEGYFATRAYAKDYVDKILAFCYTIPQRVPQLAANKKYSNYYCQYKPSHRTTWYVFFDMETDSYIIRHILNNHSEEYNDFLSGSKG